ncbi:hypothetical protein DWW50_08815 [Eubacterium sp. AF15-50]|mgnify:FL=1|uniref:hypothetical protein n=1 Tax=Eubacterium sp. AF15-50 TaxID=2293103 RepID=UPI000E4F4866|nr:hypothetical protein [Eubacterium sp. AF15-50]RHR78825.1 hypothetical protein DWW50_08815 [Eubacterium sp. AF15-50]
MAQNKLYAEIFSEDVYGEKYYLIDNGNKTWIIPEKNMKYGFGILQASNFKAKLVKIFFPVLRDVIPARKICKCTPKYLKINDGIKDIIEKYCKDKYECSVYYGNLKESVQNHKAVIQVFNKDKTFFYMKISEEKTVKDLFEKELTALKFLKEKNVRNIPAGIGIAKKGSWDIFIQENVAEDNRSCYRFLDKHWRFIADMYEKTKVKISFENSDMYEPVMFLKHCAKEETLVGEEDSIMYAIRKTESFLKNSDFYYSFAHGDFTPKNTCIKNKEVYAFDFEYCIKTATPFFDFFHYICQKSIMFNDMNIQETFRVYKKYKSKLYNYCNTPNMLFVSYLLYIIVFYLKRDDKNTDTRKGQLKFRIELIKKLLQEED